MFLLSSHTLQFCFVNINMQIQRFRKYFGLGLNRELLQLLEQQQLLLHSGIDGSAEVIRTTLFDKTIRCMHQVQLWLKLKKADGSYIYTHANTLVFYSDIPAAGSMLRVRYSPDNLKVVVIL